MNSTVELDVRRWLKRSNLWFELYPNILAGLINYSFCFILEITSVCFTVIFQVTIFQSIKVFLWIGMAQTRIPQNRDHIWLGEGVQCGRFWFSTYHRLKRSHKPICWFGSVEMEEKWWKNWTHKERQMEVKADPCHA